MTVFSQSYDLRSHISWCPATVEQILLLVSVRSQTKIHNDWTQRKIVSKHDVLRLEVSMHYTLLMHGCQTRNQSKDTLFDLSLSKVTVALLNTMEKLPA